MIAPDAFSVPLAVKPFSNLAILWCGMLIFYFSAYHTTYVARSVVCVRPPVNVYSAIRFVVVRQRPRLLTNAHAEALEYVEASDGLTPSCIEGPGLSYSVLRLIIMLSQLDRPVERQWATTINAQHFVWVSRHPTFVFDQGVTTVHRGITLFLGRFRGDCGDTGPVVTLWGHRGDAAVTR